MSEKTERIRGLKIEALRNILGTLHPPENMQPGPEYPLGGLVHIDGIGQVTVTQLRDELARREREGEG